MAHGNANTSPLFFSWSSGNFLTIVHGALRLSFCVAFFFFSNSSYFVLPKLRSLQLSEIAGSCLGFLLLCSTLENAGRKWWQPKAPPFCSFLRDHCVVLPLPNNRTSLLQIFYLVF